MRPTARNWILLGLGVVGVGFAVFILTVPQLEEAHTLGRRLAAALDPQAARQVARLYQQYYAAIAGAIAVLSGLASMVIRSPGR